MGLCESDVFILIGVVRPTSPLESTNEDAEYHGSRKQSSGVHTAGK